MAGRGARGVRLTLVALAVLVVVGALMFPVRLLLGDDPLDGAIGALGPGVGAALGVVLVDLLARRPGGFYAVADGLRSAVWSGRVPDDADAERWLDVLKTQRRAEVVAAIAAPVLLVALAAGVWLWSGSSDREAVYRVFAAALALLAVGTPLALRWELRRMDRVAVELRRRLDADGSGPRQRETGGLE